MRSLFGIFILTLMTGFAHAQNLPPSFYSPFNVKAQEAVMNALKANTHKTPAQAALQNKLEKLTYLNNIFSQCVLHSDAAKARLKEVMAGAAQVDPAVINCAQLNLPKSLQDLQKLYWQMNPPDVNAQKAQAFHSNIVQVSRQQIVVAMIDHNSIFGEGKTPDQIVKEVCKGGTCNQQALLYAAQNELQKLGGLKPYSDEQMAGQLSAFSQSLNRSAQEVARLKETPGGEGQAKAAYQTYLDSYQSMYDLPYGGLTAYIDKLGAPLKYDSDFSKLELSQDVDTNGGVVDTGRNVPEKMYQQITAKDVSGAKIKTNAALLSYSSQLTKQDNLVKSHPLNANDSLMDLIIGNPNATGQALMQTPELAAMVCETLQVKEQDEKVMQAAKWVANGVGVITMFTGIGGWIAKGAIRGGEAVVETTVMAAAERAATAAMEVSGGLGMAAGGLSTVATAHEYSDLSREEAHFIATNDPAASAKTVEDLHALSGELVKSGVTIAVGGLLVAASTPQAANMAMGLIKKMGSNVSKVQELLGRDTTEFFGLLAKTKQSSADELIDLISEGKLTQGQLKYILRQLKSC